MVSVKLVATIITIAAGGSEGPAAQIGEMKDVDLIMRPRSFIGVVTKIFKLLKPDKSK